MLRFSEGEGEVFLDPDYEPHSFWPYSSVVTDRVIQMPYKNGDRLDYLCTELVRRFQEAGFLCGRDNKIVFCFKNEEDGRLWYIGFKDLTMSVGLSFKTDDSNLGRKQRRDP